MILVLTAFGFSVSYAEDLAFGMESGSNLLKKFQHWKPMSRDL